MISFSLPYAGTTQIRFKGYFSSRLCKIMPTPSGHSHRNANACIMPVGNAFDHALWMAHLTFTAPLSMMAACLLFGVHVRYRYVTCVSNSTWGWSVAWGDST